MPVSFVSARPLARWIVVLVVGLAGGLLTGCAPSGIPATEAAGPIRGAAALAPVFRDYSLSTRRPGGQACTSQGEPQRYVESLEYVAGPPVTFGLDGADCIREIRVDYADGSRFEHTVALVTQQLGRPDGEDRARCLATAEEIQSVFWEQPEGRLEVVRAGHTGRPVLVLRPTGAPFTYARLCEGGVTRE